MAFYMKSPGGNVFKRVKTEAKRQEQLAAGWTDADAPIEATEGEQEAQQPEEETAAENAEQESAAPPEEETPAQDADAPIEAKNSYQRRASGKPRGKTVTV